MIRKNKSFARSLVPLVLALATFTLAGCAEKKPAGPPVPPKNVLIVLLDAASAKHFREWGHHRDTAPNLRKLAREGTTFLNAHSQAANTTPSVWSLFTGRYPYIPGPGYTTHHPFADDFTMADAFRVAGFRTGAISESPWILSKYGWDKGFDYFKDVSALYDHGPEKWSRDPAATQRTIDRAKDWIAEQDDAPWFCYVHLVRPHDPYDPPKPYLSRYGRANDHARTEQEIRIAALDNPASITNADIDRMGALYDANIRYVDALVGEFMTWLKEKRFRENTLIVLMSDHGEAFMEHGVFGHNTTVYEEMIHVPLVVLAPASAGFVPGQRRDIVEILDLMPTFNELFDLKSTTAYRGASLIPALRGQAPTPRPRALSFSAFDHFGLSVRKGNLKLVATVDPAYTRVVSYKLFDLTADPAESKDLSADTARLAPLLDAAANELASAERRDSSADPTLDPDDLERLKALGYAPTE